MDKDAEQDEKAERTRSAKIMFIVRLKGNEIEQSSEILRLMVLQVDPWSTEWNSRGKLDSAGKWQENNPKGVKVYIFNGAVPTPDYSKLDFKFATSSSRILFAPDKIRKAEYLTSDKVEENGMKSTLVTLVL